MPDPVWVDGATPLNSANMTKLQTRDEKGQPNGYAALDGTGLVPAAQIPAASGVPTGAGIDWFATAAPSGYLLCDGSAISRTTFAALFAVLGTTWGAGDGVTTFNLPDTRGRVIVPVAPGGNAEVNAVGLTDGTAMGSRRVRHAHNHTLTLPAHAHAINDPGHTHLLDVNVLTRADGGVSNSGMIGAGGAQNSALSGQTGITVGNPTSNPAIAGAVGVLGGTADGPSFVVANKAIKT
jgi:microcystin-dependent protein